MDDLGHKWTEEELAALERRIKKVYGQARKDLQKTVDEYFSQFVERDKHQQELLKAGKITEEQYKQWRLAQIGRGERFKNLRDKMAERYTKANETAITYVNDATPGVYSLNHNYSAYTIERVHGDVGFTLWDEQTVKRLIVEEPDVMPYYPVLRAVNRGIDLAYGKRQISAAVTSGILQGKSIGKIANDLQTRIPDMNRTSAVRAARTAMTNAQNAGRQDSYVQAAKMGIKVRKRWIAIKDMRTRHEHGAADGQTVDYDKPFDVGGEEIMFPGDRSGSPWNTYNCRCTMRTAEKEGIEAEPRQMRVRDPGTGRNVLVNEMTYKEWEKWVQSRQYSDIIGKETANGIKVKSVSSHTIERAGQRGVSQKAVLDAIQNPLHTDPVKVDEYGRKSQRFIGQTATVNINPDDGNIATVWKTGKSTRRKYEKGEK